ncbi:MAG: peptidoglycan-binding protein [Hyphomicrobiaceae bacterium]|nr:peptidoglycan-binding protein [Hyphomicrobiaceae bacterium]
MAQAPLSHDDVAWLQNELNRRGYKTGRTDGKMDSATIRAIRKFQNDNGFAATGLPTEEVMSALRADSAGVEHTPATSAQVSSPPPGAIGFKLRKGFDLPSNDYRSGLKSKKLRGISMKKCIGFCAKDNRCKAFTYNNKQRVCFLKNGVSDWVRFSGAISGVKHVAGEQQMAQQAGPNDLTIPGVADGTPDGAASAPRVRPAAFRGLLQDGDAAVIGSESVYPHAYDQSIQGARRISLLLLLKAAPEYLEKKRSTIVFTQLVPKLAQPYLKPGSNDYWRGETQIERELNRRKFLEQHKNDILALTPDLPLPITEIRPFRLGAYDIDKQRFEVKTDFHDSLKQSWYRIDGISMAGREPTALPDHWEVPLAQAQTIQAIKPKSTVEQPTLALRYEIISVRRSEGRVYLETIERPASRKIYRSARLKDEIGQLGGGPQQETGASVAGAEPQPSGAATLDLEYPGLIALQEDTTLYGNEQFIRAMFEVRRRIERKARSEKRKPHSGSFGVSKVFLNGKVKPNPTDLAAYVNWLKPRVASVKKEVQSPWGVSGGLSKGVHSIRLNELFQHVPELGYEPRIEGSPQKLAKQAYPLATKFHRIPSAKGLATYVAINQNPAWYELKIQTDVPGGSGGRYSATTDLVLRSRKLLRGSTANQHVLVLEFDPIKVALRPGKGKSFVKAIAPAEGAATAARTGSDKQTAGGKFDIRGLKVGLSISDILKTLESLSGERALVIRQGKTKNAQLTDFIEATYTAPPVGAGVEFDPDQGKYVKVDPKPRKILTERYIILHASDFSDRSIVVGRQLKLAAETFKAFVASDPLTKKYGKPTFKEYKDTHKMWAAQPATRTRIAKNGYSYRNSCLNPDASRHGLNLPEKKLYYSSRPCGEILDTWTDSSPGHVIAFLVDTDALALLRSRPKTAAAKSKPKPKPPESGIKF